MYFDGNITFKGITSGSLGVIVSSMPKLQHSTVKATEYDIPLRDGIQYSSWRNRTDAQITAQFAVLKDNNRDFIQTLRATRQWLEGSGVLILGNNPDVYYNVKKVEITNEDMYTLASGELEATFVVEPFEYMVDDTEIEEIIPLADDVVLTIENDGDVCKPFIETIPYEGTSSATYGWLIQIDSNPSVKLEYTTVSNYEPITAYCDSNLMYTYAVQLGSSMSFEDKFKNHNYEDMWIPHGTHTIRLRTVGYSQRTKVIINLRRGYAI